MNIQARMERLRELTYQPTAKNWTRICALLEQWPDDEGLSEGMDYAAEALDKWPASDHPAVDDWTVPLRKAPFKLAEKIAQGRATLPMWWHLVRCFHIHDGRFKGDALLQLVQSPAMTHITHLYLTQCRPKAGLLKAVIDSSTLPNLHHLNLYSSQVTAADLDALLESPLAPRLTGLDLGACSMDSDTTARFATTKALPNLRMLRLSHNTLSDDTAIAILDSPHYPQLQMLSMCTISNSMMDYRLNELAKDHGLPHMRLASYGGVLEHATVGKLKASCKTHGVKGYSKLKRGALIHKLLERNPWTT